MRVEIRSQVGDPDAELESRARRRLAFALSRFGRLVGRVLVRLSASPGASSRGAERCRVVVRLRDGRTVAVEQSGHDLATAVDLAAERAGRAVAREMLRGDRVG